MTESSPFPSRCDHCGVPLQTGVRYPTATEDESCGDVRIYTFCDEQCKSAWQSTDGKRERE